MTSATPDLDAKLRRALCDHHRKYDNRYQEEARNSLLETLFRALTNDREDYLHGIFPDGFPSSYRLQDAQGREEEPEYSVAARGTLCGHIFKTGEVTYHCGTCTDDPTAVLCARCFAASDHEGHALHINVSSGNAGCCDCGDDEAWNRPVHCAIHTASADREQVEETVTLPEDLQASIRITIGRVLDFFCDVISCSPEHLRLPKSIESIKEDEVRSRLSSRYYVSEDDEEANPEFSLLIWNDEKHTVREVRDQVARACRERISFGQARADETNDVGRSVVRHSRDLKQLTQMAKIIEQIKITVTIRSSRDTFREQMCGTIIDWLGDITGCSIGGNQHILRRMVCEQLLKVWRVGSLAWNARTGEDSLDQHGLEQERAHDKMIRRRFAQVTDPIQMVLRPVIVPPAAEFEEDDEGGEGMEVEGTDDDLDDIGDGRPIDITQTTTFQILDQALNAHFGDVDVIDDTEEMDTDGDGDGDGDLMDINEQPSNDLEPIDVAATPTPGPRIDAGHLAESGQNVNYMNVPRVHPKTSRIDNGPPEFWLMPNPEQQPVPDWLPPHEDLTKSIRLDYMIIFDLRLWKVARNSLRDLYIGTIVKIPEFKRILGLRFSGLYTTLAQLYLIADREPDHSIINLSLQILTTPSICQERIEKGNFLTNVMAVLYTFLTNRQVGFADDVDPEATLSFDPGAVANRRLFHFFQDLKYFLSSEHVQAKVRNDARYLSQYLDLMKLLQGICPNIRAVGDHVEYETDTWISAAMLTKDSNKLCRTFAEAYQGGESNAICDAISLATAMTIVNSVGLERKRFGQNEIKELVLFHHTTHKVVKFAVAQGALSFHHPLHYTLSWLLEMSKESSACLRALRESAENVVRQVREANLAKADLAIKASLENGEDALLAMFDYPLRVCAWLAQMKANMWVRNGMSLRHQMGQYKSVGYRDVAHQRDLFLLQTALVACDPSRVLASMIDRFGLSDWMSPNYTALVDCDDLQMVDLAEDLIYLLINLLSDRDNLTSTSSDPDTSLITVRKEIAHSLCFKALSYTDLYARLTERVTEHPKLQETLASMTKFRPPEGLHDSGLFELKEEYFQELDPYNSHFSKNQRDEAESIYKKWLGRKLKKDPEDVVLEPKLNRITSEAYTGLAAVSQCKLFVQVIYRALMFAAEGFKSKTGVTSARAESFLQIVLQLALIATLEDHSVDSFDNIHQARFVGLATNFPIASNGRVSTILRALHQIWLMEEFSASRSKIRHILRLFNQKTPILFAKATQGLDFPSGRFDTSSPANMENEIEAKKRQAMERKAKVMAQFQQQQQSFIDKQGGIDWGDDELDVPDAELPSSTESRAWKFPSGLCIQCREETTDAKLYGTFAMITDGHLLRETVLEDPDFVKEVVNSPDNLDRSLNRERPYGVSGSNDRVVSQMDSMGQATQVKRQALSKGWPAGATAKGPLTSNCGHIMHFSCFENYYASIMRRHAQQVARQHPERVGAQEFVCPLCKALANSFIPIVWKSTIQSYPASLRTTTEFSDFVETELEGRASLSDINDDRFTTRMTTIHQATLSDLANSALKQAVEAAQTPGLGSPSAAVRAGQEELLPLAELAGVYVRLKGPLNIIARVTQPGVFPAKFHDGEQPNSFHLLLNALANTICATEIAYRGREAEFGTTLLTGIPQQTLSHLQVLSSTVRSYAASCHVYAHSSIDQHFQQVYLSIFSKIFGRVSSSEEPVELETIFLENFSQPLLQMDAFTFLVHASTALCPILEIEYRHMLRLAFTSEILRVMLAYSYDHNGLSEAGEAIQDPTEDEGHSLRTLQSVLEWLETQFNDHSNTEMKARFQTYKDSLTVKSLAGLLRVVEKYSLVFLRKSAIFCHVAQGVDFPTTAGTEASLPELVRLSHFMQLPSITEILEDLTDFAPMTKTKQLIACWLADLTNVANKESRNVDKAQSSGYAFDIRGEVSSTRKTALGLRLLHPAPLELIGLPKYYDILIELSARKSCPRTGKELNDPAMCLFCGEIFCSQSVCCQTADGRGGCNLHIEKCSKPVGMFLFIRKCNVVLLHVIKDPNAPNSPSVIIGGNFVVRSGDTPPLGSFFQAPYLTKHGETDGGLRIKQQLILSQMRYDRLLRDTWLMVNGSVWSAIARKLEGEVNSGGWETL